MDYPPQYIAKLQNQYIILWYPRGGLSYSDIHDQEVLDSLSDRPWKEKEVWNANRRLLLNCSFSEYSQYYALKRTRTSTLFSTRFWVSRVYHFTTLTTGDPETISLPGEAILEDSTIGDSERVSGAWWWDAWSPSGGGGASKMGWLELLLAELSAGGTTLPPRSY